MSRYTLTVTSEGHSDPDAVIGFDPPLRTFFLQAFSDETSDDLALWLGTCDREFETLDTLHAAARNKGYDFMPLAHAVAAQLNDDRAKEVDRPPHDGPLAAFLRHLQSE
jgi:hypothetical protein